MVDVLCEIAQCPLTGQPLVPVGGPELAAINARVADRSLEHADGAAVAKPLAQAVRTRDGAIAYRVDGKLAALLPELAILLQPGAAATPPPNTEKSIVRNFYETFGWQKEAGEFRDTLTFVDRRPASMEYLNRCHRRMRRHLATRGRFFLDAASGPVHHEEYRRFSEGFDYRVCVDFSAVALVEAQQNLGDHGVYVVGDVTRLPFRADAFEAAVSLHTIYHVPSDEQRAAFEELYRVLKPNGTSVVVYQWPRNRALGAIWDAARNATAAVRRTLGRRSPTRAAPPLYAHAHTYEWFRSQEWPFDAEVRVWRSVGGGFLRRFVPGGHAGRFVLHLLYALEERAPRIAGRFGRFPMIVIRK